MDQSKISVRYAKALFMTAFEANTLSEVNTDLEAIMSEYRRNLFREILESPVVKPSEKRNMINEIFTGRISKLSLDFLNLLLINKREKYIPAIMRNFKSQYKQSMGIKSAELTVARKIDEKFMSSFKDLLKNTYNSKIELVEKIKPEIIGGFILKVEDEQYDASISSSLVKMKKKLSEAKSIIKI